MFTNILNFLIANGGQKNFYKYIFRFFVSFYFI